MGGRRARGGRMRADGDRDLVDRADRLGARRVRHRARAPGRRQTRVRAFRRGAGLVRGTSLPVAELVRNGRATDLRGIGPPDWRVTIDPPLVAAAR